MDTKRKSMAGVMWALIVLAVVGLLAICIMAGMLSAAGVWLAAHLPDQAQPRLASQPGGDTAARPEVSAPSGELLTSASLQAIRGLVEVQNDSGVWTPVMGDQPILQGQSVRTGAFSQAELRLPDGSLVSLSAQTEMRIDDLAVNPQQKKRSVVLSQLAGESTHQVAAYPASNSDYQVRTPQASGEAVGTEFKVEVSPGGAERFAVSEGSLNLTAMQQTVSVGAGESSLVAAGETPSPPLPLIFGQGLLTAVGETWEIDGQTYQLHPATLIVGNPQVGDIVFVEGRLLPDGTRLADLIVLLHTSPAQRFDLTGEVTQIEADFWTIAGQTIAITNTTQVDPGLVVGDLARAEGVILETGELLAERITSLEEGGGLPFAFSGVVQQIDPWLVSGVPLAVVSTTVIDEGLAVGDVVDVSGSILEDGTWQAARIARSLAGSQAFEITGELQSLQPWQVAGITLVVNAWTEIDEGLEIGDLVRVTGRIQQDGSWLAYSIQRVDFSPNPLIVFIGTVISIDPWVVNGIPLNVTPETIIVGNILPGMLVRVEVSLLPDGSWQVLRITALDDFAWFPACIDVSATVLSLEGNQVQFLGWPTVQMGDDLQVEGELTPYSVVHVIVCFHGDGQLIIIQIIVIYPGEIEIEPPPVGERVTICHKPNKKKGGNTITISSSALPAHLAHGDTVGPCP